MFSWEIYEDGVLFGVCYSFDEAGAGIGMHDHTDRDDAHNVICLRGIVAVYGPDYAWSELLEAGQILTIGPDRLKHEVRALVPGTRTLHLYTAGRPAELGGRKLAPEDRRGYAYMPPTMGWPPS